MIGWSCRPASTTTPSWALPGWSAWKRIFPPVSWAAILSGAGFAVRGGAPLFMLAEAADAARRFERLAEAGILTRRFAARPTLLRFAIPRGAANQARLSAALGQRISCPV